MSKYKLLYYFWMILKFILSFYIIKIFLYKDFYSLFYQIKNNKNNHFFPLIYQMMKNLSIYRTIYEKSQKGERFFLNDDSFIGNISYGYYDHGQYYKRGSKSYYEKYPKELINKLDLLNYTEKILYPEFHKGNLLYSGSWKNNEFIKGIYVDVQNSVIYNGTFRNNKIYGTGNLYFMDNSKVCNLTGEFEDNELKKIYQCSCKIEICRKKIEMEIEVENFLINTEVSWGLTWLMEGGYPQEISFFVDIFLPILWILFLFTRL